MKRAKAKYYDEEVMRELRAGFERVVRRWPHVTARRMFGCPCYLARGKMFAFLVTGGVVITRLSEDERLRLAGEREAEAFVESGRTIAGWMCCPVEGRMDVEDVEPFLRIAHARALAATDHRPSKSR